LYLFFFDFIDIISYYSLNQQTSNYNKASCRRMAKKYIKIIWILINRQVKK
jgi:hypothetical protein